MLNFKSFASATLVVLIFAAPLTANAALPPNKLVSYTYTGHDLTTYYQFSRLGGTTSPIPDHGAGLVLDVLAPDFLPANQTITFTHVDAPYYDLTLTLDAQGGIKAWDITRVVFEDGSFLYWWTSTSDQSGAGKDRTTAISSGDYFYLYNTNQPGQWTKTLIDRADLFTRGDRLFAPLPGVGTVPEADAGLLAMAGLLTIGGWMRRKQPITAP